MQGQLQRGERHAGALLLSRHEKLCHAGLWWCAAASRRADFVIVMCPKQYSSAEHDHAGVQHA